MMAELMDGMATGTLGNLVDWLTTNTHPTKRQYFRIILADGTELDHPEIEALSHRDEFAAWRAAL